jgi:DNA-binding SARP family transcriptional activator
MTLQTPQRPARAASVGRGAATTRGLIALLLLTALAAGPPAALVAFVGNPIPEQAVVGGRLTDAAVIGLLAAVVWAAWAQLMLAVVVEAAAAARGAAIPPRIPLSGPQQILARRLVVASSLLLAGTTALSAPALAAPAQAVTAAAIPACPQPSPAPHAHALGPLTASGPGVANPPSAESGDQTLRFGSANPAGHASGRQQPEHKWYVVQEPRHHRHDTLWDIAERHLGDGLRWKEIYQLNRGREQHDGRSLDHAGLILPGWRLRMPADAIGLPHDDDQDAHRARSPEGQPRREAPPRPPQQNNPEADSTGTPAIAPQRDATAELPGPPASQSPQSRPAAGPMAVQAPAAEVAAPGASESLEDRSAREVGVESDGRTPIAGLTFGLGALACAGLAGELTRRRHRARRVRRPGERLVSLAPAETCVEARLRSVDAELTVARVRTAFRELAFRCYQTGRSLPDLLTVRLTAGSAELRLGADEPDAVPPFTSLGARTWRLDPQPFMGEGATASTPSDDDPVDPYPALVAVGIDSTGPEAAVVLVNLEAVGTLHIDGPVADTAPILHALAAELGTSPLADSAMLTLVGCPDRLRNVCDSDRTRHQDHDRAHRWATTHIRDVARLLGDAGLPDLRAARSRRTLDDLWAPEVLIECGEDSAVTPINAPPYGGLCVLTTGPVDGVATGGDPDSAWTLRRGEDGWRLDPIGIDLDPQQLDPAALATLDELMDVKVVVPPELSSPRHFAGDERTASNGTAGHGNGPGPATLPDWKLPAPTDAAAADVPVATPIPSFDRSASVALDSEVSDRGAFDPDEPEDIPTSAPPRVLVLGPVELVGAVDEYAPPRPRRSIELAAYLTLHPGVTQHQLDEAMWPGARVPKETRNPLISRTRRWLGRAPHGGHYLEHFGENSGYGVRPDIGCDWHDFQALAGRGLAAGPDGADDLAAALDLVRGRPFLGVTPHTYTWAEADTQEMLAAIVDTAHALAELALAAGDHRRARWAASAGLTADPYAELLYQDAIRAAKAAGDAVDVQHLLTLLRRRIEEIDPTDDVDEATGALCERKSR